MKEKTLKEWKTKSGLIAKAVLFSEGYINGYVKAPRYLKGTRCHNLQNIDVHGGVTFAGRLQNINEDNEGWWIGFDTAHIGDGKNFDLVKKEIFDQEENPDMSEYYNTNDIFGNSSLDESTEKFRDLDYVVNECEKLAKQLVEYNEDKELEIAEALEETLNYEMEMEYRFG